MAMNKSAGTNTSMLKYTLVSLSTWVDIKGENITKKIETRIVQNEKNVMEVEIVLYSCFMLCLELCSATIFEMAVTTPPLVKHIKSV